MILFYDKNNSVMKRIEYKDVKFYFSDIRTKEHIFSLLSFCSYV